MGRESTRWRSLGPVLALCLCASALVACGSDDDSQGSGEPAEPLAQAAPGDLPPGPAGDRAEPADQGPEQGNGRPGKHKGKAPGAPVSSDDASSAQALPPTDPATPADQPPRRNPRPPKSKPPKLAPPGKAKVKPPPFLPGGGGDPYQVARQLCGDRQLVESVPPEYRGTAEEMATMYADLFDPDNKEQAYEGCLAGLRGLGY